MVYITQHDVKSYLGQLAVENPDRFMPKLEKGSLVQKAGSLFYEIDDLGIIGRLGSFPEGSVPYGKINKALLSRDTGDKAKLVKQLEEDFRYYGEKRGMQMVMPFSRVFDFGRGECLENAVLVQLSAQTGRDSFLINGLLGIEDNGICPLADHGYNLVFKEGIPHLVDATNPITDDNRNFVPCIVPVTGIEAGAFQVPEKFGHDRVYLLY